MTLIPERISDEKTNELIRIISNLAKEPDKLETDKYSTSEEKLYAKYAKLILKNCNLFHYSLPEIPNGKIILSSKVYDKLCELASKSNKKDRILLEYGAYLYGEEISPNCIYFYENNYHETINSPEEVNTPNILVSELERVIEETPCDCIAHIHTHPYAEGHYSSYPSNQDLYTYAHLQENFNQTDRDIFFIGGLITPLNSSPAKVRLNDLCFIFYDKNAKYFYKCDNISVIVNNEEILLRKVEYRPKGRGLVLKENRTLLQTADKLEANI